MMITITPELTAAGNTLVVLTFQHFNNISPQFTQFSVRANLLVKVPNMNKAPDMNGGRE